MPVTPTYPGIYIQEAPSSTHTIVAAPTNIAVFIGYAHPLKTPPGNFGKALQIFGFMDYQRLFGGFVRSAAFTYASQIRPAAGSGPVFSPPASPPSTPEDVCGDLALAVNQFFLNGGTTAYIVAVNGTNAALPTTGAMLTVSGVTFTALEITDEVYQMSVSVAPLSAAASAMPNDPLADITITYGPVNPASGSVSGPGTTVETYRRVSLNQFMTSGPANVPNPNYIETRLGTGGVNGIPVSALVTVAGSGTPPAGGYTAGVSNFPISLPSDTAFVSPSDFTPVLQQDTSLDKVPVLNLMVIPGVTDPLVVSTAQAFCERKMTFLILDPIITDSADGSVPGFPNLVQDSVGTMGHSKNAAFYFPYLLSPDPISGSSTNAVTGLPNEIPPAPTVAGIFAATDVARGVWKAPAGFQANTNNTTGVVERGRMTDQRQGTLNPISVNCLRDFANVGTIVFGSRTFNLTDQQWTYVPVRRMALFLEQTFLANLKWVIFEPNDTPLWSAITMSLNAFMLGLFKQGAFQGATPSAAFNVQCNSQTTTQADIDSGIVNIVVSFAPLKPAEFVVITIAQLAGQTQTS
jgi:hypothetical protein